MKRLVVNKKYNGKKLNRFLQDNIPNLSNNLFYKTLRQKDIKVNDKRVNNNIIVYLDDKIQVYIDDKLLEDKTNIKIIYEDDNILVINKKANIEVTGENSLTTQVNKKYSNKKFKPMPCHRIDRNTTGLVIFAKNQETLNIIFDKFKKHEIEKHYLALVYGTPKKKCARLEDYLFKDNKKSRVYVSNIPKKGYQKIVTEYKVIKENKNNTTLLDVQIETGRTHQIRAHLAYIGYPIVGDGKYGINEINKRLGYKYQQLKSYKIKFNFTTDAGILNYLKDKEVTLS